MKTACILGGNGFIGHHMARRLKSEGYFVRVVDIKEYEYGPNNYADEVVIGDLRDLKIVEASLRLQNFEYSFLIKPFEDVAHFDEVYAFACLMGGAGFVFTGDNDADIMHDSALINLNIANTLKGTKSKIFYSSSACMYPQEKQSDNRPCPVGEDLDYSLCESDAYPLNPDSDYGLEKAFSERLYLAYQRNYNLNVRIARFHNIYGPEGTYKGGKEKAPAAMCRKVVEAKDLSEIEVWGDGNQTRSFLYIDDCIDAVRLLMDSDFKDPINIGSEEMVKINDLAQMTIDLSGKDIRIKNIPGPTGVRGRNSNNDLIREKLGWEPKYNLSQGLEKTFNWIKSQYV